MIRREAEKLTRARELLTRQIRQLARFGLPDERRQDQLRGGPLHDVLGEPIERQREMEQALRENRG